MVGCKKSSMVFAISHARVPPMHLMLESSMSHVMILGAAPAMDLKQIIRDGFSDFFSEGACDGLDVRIYDGSCNGS